METIKTSLTGPNKTKTVPGKPRSNAELIEYFKNRHQLLKVVKTTHTPSGHTLDWIPKDSQLKTGKIASPPPAPGKLTVTHNEQAVRTSVFELHQPNVDRGPEGTVPILRKNLSKVTDHIKLADHLAKKGSLVLCKKVQAKKQQRDIPAPRDSDAPDPFGYFHASSGETVDNFGCDGYLNMWKPGIDSDDHSIMQCWLTNGETVLQTVEAGWTVDNILNGNDSPHLFLFYTTNGYTDEDDNKGGYNTDYDGWVQYDQNIYPGALINGISTVGGDQYEISIKFQLYQGNWWFAIQGIWLGYYPASLFSGTFQNKATDVRFGGEVNTRLNDPTQTKDQMGSGNIAESGWKHACFQHNLRYQIHDNGLMSDLDGDLQEEDSALYDIQTFMKTDGGWRSYFYAGGQFRWVNNSLTGFANGTIARRGSALDGYWGSDSSQHVNFIDERGHVHELFIRPGRAWIDNDLTIFTKGALAATGSRLSGYWGSDSSQHVNFIDANGHIHELFIRPGAAWVDNDLTHFTNGVPAAPGSALHGYWGSDGTQHVNYLDAHGHIHELFIRPGGAWVDNDLTHFTNGVPAVAGSAVQGYWGNDSTQHVNYFDSNGHVHELFIRPGGSWVDNDLTRFSNGAHAAAGSGLTGYWGSNDSQHVNYLDLNGHVRELYIHPGAAWVDNDLTLFAGSGPAAARSALAGYWGADSSQHVIYFDSTGDVHELYIHPGAAWLENNLTAFSDSGPAEPGSDLDGYWGTDNSQHINFTDAGGRVRELFLRS